MAAVITAVGGNIERHKLLCVCMYVYMYAVGSESFRPDQLFKVTEIRQLCYFST